MNTLRPIFISVLFLGLTCVTAFALETAPKEYVRFNNEGVKKMEQGDFDGAVKNFSQSIAINPKFVLPYINRGLIEENQFRNLKKALADYDQALQVSPGDLFALSDRARVFEKLRKFDKALADYSTLIDLHPSSQAKFLKARARVRQQAKDQAGAREDLAKAQSIEKNQEQNKQ